MVVLLLYVKFYCSPSHVLLMIKWYFGNQTAVTCLTVQYVDVALDDYMPGRARAIINESVMWAVFWGLTEYHLA